MNLNGRSIFKKGIYVLEGENVFLKKRMQFSGMKDSFLNKMQNKYNEDTSLLSSANTQEECFFAHNLHAVFGPKTSNEMRRMYVRSDLVLQAKRGIKYSNFM